MALDEHGFFAGLADAGARTFLSAAALEVNQRVDNRHRKASGSCFGQECLA